MSCHLVAECTHVSKVSEVSPSGMQFPEPGPLHAACCPPVSAGHTIWVSVSPLWFSLFVFVVLGLTVGLWGCWANAPSLSHIPSLILKLYS